MLARIVRHVMTNLGKYSPWALAHRDHTTYRREVDRRRGLCDEMVRSAMKDLSK